MSAILIIGDTIRNPELRHEVPLGIPDGQAEPANGGLSLDAPDETREWHELCREALELAVAEIRPGVNGGDVHRLVSELFAERGFPTQLTKPEGEVLRDGFYHGLGHGVGLEVHESPSLGMVGEELVPGDVITIEPGLYRHGFGGVRVEDLLLVTEDGYERLTDCPYELEV